MTQLLEHPVYAETDNVIPTPLILPKLDWSSPTSVFQAASSGLDARSNAIALTDSKSGFGVSLAAAGTIGASATMSTAVLPASLASQHLPAGVSSSLYLVHVSGSGLDLSRPGRLTLPNLSGYKPGAVVELVSVNLTTGGHDVTGRMVVSDDGKTMTSMDPVMFTGGGEPLVQPQASGTSVVALSATQQFYRCWAVVDGGLLGAPVTQCDGCQPGAKGTGGTPSSEGGGGQLPKLTNFGLARIIHGALNREASGGV